MMTMNVWQVTYDRIITTKRLTAYHGHPQGPRDDHIEVKEGRKRVVLTKEPSIHEVKLVLSNLDLSMSSDLVHCRSTIVRAEWLGEGHGL